MIKLDENKLAKLRTSSEHLTEKYGELGSPEREEFEARAKAYYYAELLKEQWYAAFYFYADCECFRTSICLGDRVVTLVKSSKLSLFRQYIARCLALSTNGVYQQHDVCGTSARYVRSNNMLSEDGNIEC